MAPQALELRRGLRPGYGRPLRRERQAQDDHDRRDLSYPQTFFSAIILAAIVAFRKHRLLPLDDCLHALQPTVPHLARSSRHRCPSRHGISRLPDIEGGKLARKTFKSHPIGCFHIDVAEVQTAEGKLYLFVAIDRTSRFAFAELQAEARKTNAARFLRNAVTSDTSSI